MCSVLLLAVLIGTCPDDALRDFHDRLDAYMQLHRSLEVHTPPRTITRDVAKIIEVSDALADAIVAARPDARQGDIFTPAAVKIFRERIATALAGTDTDRYLDSLYEGVDYRTLRAAIYARDPDSLVPLGLPMDLLLALPELPDEIDYRLIGRDLALWDEHAAMVIDFIANAIPEVSLAMKGGEWP